MWFGGGGREIVYSHAQTLLQREGESSVHLFPN